MMPRRCSSQITPQSTSTMHSGVLIMDPLSQKKHIVMTSYTLSDEYEPRPFDAVWPEGSTILYCLSYTAFMQKCSDKLPKIIIKSKALDVCDACCIFCNCYKSLKKESYEK